MTSHHGSPEDLPIRFAAWRAHRKLSQSQLALRAGSCQSSVSKIESGVLEPTMGLLATLIRGGLNTTWAIFWSKLPKPRTSRRVKAVSSGARS